jgi:hypothetical protein
MSRIVVTRRVTSPFLEAIPPQVELFDAYIYAVVKRKPGKDIPDHKFGEDARLDPCVLNWQQKTITIELPLNINHGIDSIDDLDPDWYEAVEAAFITLINGCL